MEGLHVLGHAGSDSFQGLEIIDLDESMAAVQFNTDEFTAVCPVTAQPDQYQLLILLENTSVTIESKSLKLYLHGFRNEGCFAENLAIRIKKEVAKAIGEHLQKGDSTFLIPPAIGVTIIQKPRGGIEIEATTT